MAALELGSMANRTLAEIVTTSARRFPTMRKFAGEIGLSESHLGRIAKGRVLTADLDTCLTLTRFSNASAAEILRAAGHEGFVKVLERHFGPARRRVPIELPPDEEACLALWRQLRKEQREAVEGLIGSFISGGKKTRPRQDAAVVGQFERGAREVGTAVVRNTVRLSALSGMDGFIEYPSSSPKILQ